MRVRIFGVPTGEIQLELANRRAVGRQEDMIVDVTGELTDRSTRSVMGRARTLSSARM
jgi:hypothetical protein